MKLLVSWSGGKDCMLALYRVLSENRHEVACLVNMCGADGETSRSHGLKASTIVRQASSLGINIIQPATDFKNYENEFKKAITLLKKQGVTGGVFGDIYLQEHRDWIERVCSEQGIVPMFPLWKANTTDLIREFVLLGFKAKVVSVNDRMLAQSWLGRDINNDFIADILKMPVIDPCAENGEYHSFVFDGPIFGHPVEFTQNNTRHSDNHWFLNIL